MTEIVQGIIPDDFENLTQEDLNIIIFALEQLRSREESVRLSSSGRNKTMLPETEISARALVAYEKLINFDDRVKSEIGIREFILVPIARHVLKRLCLAFDRQVQSTQVWKRLGGERPGEDSQRID